MTAQLPPPGDDQDERGVADNDDLLTLMIDELQRNWEREDNAANDELVIRIREHLRSQRPATPSPFGDTGSEWDGYPAEWNEDWAAVPRLPQHTQTVADDLAYWSGHGVQVVSIRPRIDGVGAVIGIRRLTNHIVTAMRERYAFPVHCWDALPPA
jgi:hypothetical protein